MIGIDKIVFKSKKKLAKAIVKRYSNNEKMPKIGIKIQFEQANIEEYSKKNRNVRMFKSTLV